MKYAEVILPLPLFKTFTYHLDQLTQETLQPGQRLRVPFHRGYEIGFLFKSHEKKPTFKTRPLQAVDGSAPLFDQTFMDWLVWAHQYYLTPLGEVFSASLPSLLFADLSYETLIQKKVRRPVLAEHWQDNSLHPLNPAQEKILGRLLQSQNEKAPKPHLLHGVTGSGKTEIYLHWARKIVAEGGQVLLLVPEIGLTPQMVGRFHGIFGDNIALIHSHLTENQRFLEWNRARLLQADIVIGTRSALFTPMPRLRAIIIDEEHDGSYKQEERFRYHARDMAIMRGKLLGIPVLLGSATPSLESYQNACTDRFDYSCLTERAGVALLPSITVVDTKAQKRQRNSPLILCPELIQAITSNLVKQEQTLLLLNRRGFARSLFCFACEVAERCPHCSVNLIFHKQKNYLLCHYCDFKRTAPKTCTSCGEPRLALLGTGTESLEEELTTLFPHARICRLDRDATAKQGTLLKILKEIREHRVDIVVGTQILAKGHDLPKVSLVGVIGADAGLGLPDFRATERNFQLITQVSGRSGRGAIPGQVIIQTMTPGHYSIQLAKTGDYEGFTTKELAFRRELNYPPFGRLIQFLFQATQEKKLQEFLQKVFHGFSLSAKQGENILGPSPAPLARLKQAYRYQVMIKAPTSKRAHEIAQTVMEKIKEQECAGIKWSVDVDPLTML